MKERKKERNTGTKRRKDRKRGIRPEVTTPTALPAMYLPRKVAGEGGGADADGRVHVLGWGKDRMGGMSRLWEHIMLVLLVATHLFITKRGRVAPRGTQCTADERTCLHACPPITLPWSLSLPWSLPLLHSPHPLVQRVPFCGTAPSLTAAPLFLPPGHPSFPGHCTQIAFPDQPLLPWSPHLHVQRASSRRTTCLLVQAERTRLQHHMGGRTRCLRAGCTQQCGGGL